MAPSVRAGSRAIARSALDPLAVVGHVGNRGGRAGGARVRTPRARRAARPEDTGARSRGARRAREAGTPERVAEGVVEVLGNGSAFLRVEPPEPSDADVYISAAQVRRCELVSGDRVSGPVRAPRRSERYPSLVRVETINGESADSGGGGNRYDDLPAPIRASGLRLIPRTRRSRRSSGSLRSAAARGRDRGRRALRQDGDAAAIAGRARGSGGTRADARAHRCAPGGDRRVAAGAGCARGDAHLCRLG